jgi:hypothetical protein
MLPGICKNSNPWDVLGAIVFAPSVPVAAVDDVDDDDADDDEDDLDEDADDT